MSRFSNQIRDRLRDVASTVLLRHQTSDALFAVLDDIQSAHDMDAAMSRMLSAVVAADDDVALCKSAEQAAVMAESAAKLGQVDTSGKNAATDVRNQLTGYGSRAPYSF